MSEIYSKEDIVAKLEWEGIDEGITWFEPAEVPEEIREAWALALTYKEFFDGYLNEIQEWADSE